jgi:hypothetical protein
MSEELQKLIEATKSYKISIGEREAQRRSFAYGNTNIENSRITRQMIDEQAEELNTRGAKD